MVGHDYAGDDDEQPFVASGAIAAPTSTALTLSAATLTYGHEHAEELSATAKAANGTPVTGTAKVEAGSRVVCSITLSAPSPVQTLKVVK